MAAPLVARRDDFQYRHNMPKWMTDRNTIGLGHVLLRLRFRHEPRSRGRRHRDSAAVSFDDPTTWVLLERQHIGNRTSGCRLRQRKIPARQTIQVERIAQSRDPP